MKNERIMAVDFGTVRIGIALSDLSQFLASPLTTIKNDKQAAGNILNLLRENEVKTLVIGYPLNLMGEAASSAQKVDAFITKFKKVKINIIRWDERFSTSTAIDLLHQAGKKPFKNKGKIDRSAAAVILQDYLDSQ